MTPFLLIAAGVASAFFGFLAASMLSVSRVERKEKPAEAPAQPMALAVDRVWYEHASVN